MKKEGTMNSLGVPRNQVKVRINHVDDPYQNSREEVLIKKKNTIYQDAPNQTLRGVCTVISGILIQAVSESILIFCRCWESYQLGEI